MVVRIVTAILTFEKRGLWAVCYSVRGVPAKGERKKSRIAIASAIFASQGTVISSNETP